MRFNILLSSRNDWTCNHWCVVKPNGFLLCVCENKKDAQMITKIFNKRKGGTDGTVEWTYKVLSDNREFAQQFASLINQRGYLQTIVEKSRGISVRLRIRVKLENKHLVEKIRSELGFGTITELMSHDGYIFAVWQTGKRKFIANAIIPMLDRFPPTGDRLIEYQLWKSIALKIVDGAHLDDRRSEVLGIVEELQAFQSKSLIKLTSDLVSEAVTN